MRVLTQWTDDHLPCFCFEHNEYLFEVWWSDRALVGKLEMVEDGEITLEKALKKYPDLLKIVTDPINNDVELDDEVGEDGKRTYQTEAGYVEVKKAVEGEPLPGQY